MLTIDNLMDPQLFNHFQELTAALIEYTPPHFKIVHCIIKGGVEQGQPALFYEISCPEFPDEGTTEVNPRTHQAATRLVQYWTRDGGTFPGLRVILELQEDGSWQNSITRLDAVEDLEETAEEDDILEGEPQEDAEEQPAKPWWKFW